MKTGVGKAGGRRKAEGGRQEDGKCPLRLRSKKIFHKGLARGTTQLKRSGGKVTKRKWVATTLDDKDNVDQRKENPYENRAFTCQWICRKRYDCRTCGGSEPRKEGLTVRILSV